MIELKKITKQFHHKSREITALSKVSLTVPKGKIFGVIGASGAGKSTLIRCVNLLERPTSGEVIVDGVDLLKLTPAQLAKERRQIGMIFQHFNLLSSRTVFDNIAFPLELEGLPKEEIRQRVTALLSLVGLEEKQHDYPVSLSGGQKQRVAIARTLASNPKVLLCDEATSALDPATTKSILVLLKDINKRLDITILLITHEMDVVKNICDEVAVISAGQLIEQGTVSEIFAHPKEALTAEFVASSLKVDLPAEYTDRLVKVKNDKNKPLLKLDFTGLSAGDAVISEVSRLFQLDNNIIYAQIENAGGVQFGTMVVEVSGTEENNQKAIAHYQTKQIKVEVLGYV
ncbi:methionine ABC transporter ATP-binding protein MetN [Pedobacter sp. AW31-3R]|uniref:methionine ABC transporter ATP-binding protein MetN n=1 Tax=Pedobacter sp. AW31-3R TaxID=3445781 RepID=UPI003F9F7B6B